MKILRLCRTLPCDTNPGAGMHCFKYSVLSKYESVILTKEKITKIISFPREIPIYQMKYRDLTAKSSNLKFLNKIAVAATKIWGEMVCIINMLSLIRKENFFFIHIHSINYLIAGVFAKIIFKIPIGLNIGGTDFYRAKNIWFYRILLKKVDKIFYVSSEIKGELLKIVEEPVLVHTSNGFNSEVFYNTNSIKKDFLVSVGNLRWQKNHTLLIKSFFNVLNELPHLKLLIIGSGPEREGLENLVTELGIASNVSFLGQINQYEIASIMNQSKLFCLSSVSEGFPKVILEAFSCGLPVLSTNAGDCKNIIKNGGAIVDSNPEAYSKKVIELLKSNNLSKYSERATQISQKYSWTNVVNSVDAAYDNFK
jgi:L-malate glycosyltransferase